MRLAPGRPDRVRQGLDRVQQGAEVSVHRSAQGQPGRRCERRAPIFPIRAQLNGTVQPERTSVRTTNLREAERASNPKAVRKRLKKSSPARSSVRMMKIQVPTMSISRTSLPGSMITKRNRLATKGTKKESLFVPFIPSVGNLLL